MYRISTRSRGALHNISEFWLNARNVAKQTNVGYRRNGVERSLSTLRSEQQATELKYLEETNARQNSPVWSWNDFDRLEEVIVGRVDGAMIAEFTPDIQVYSNEWEWDMRRTTTGKPYPNEHITKAHKQIEEFCKILEHEGVVVKRPDIMDWSKGYKTPDFTCKVGVGSSMPRDVLLAIGNEIIEAPMSARARYFEYSAYRTLIKDYFQRGARWTTGPKPQMSDELYDEKHIRADTEGRKKLALQGTFVTTEFEPCFDAPDFIRAGWDVFAQRSQVTNHGGIEWIRRHLEPRGFRVHTLDFNDDNPVHTDSTFNIIGPGLVVSCPERPCSQVAKFKKAGWKIVDAPMPTEYDHTEFQSSKWLSMNVLMLDPKRVVVDKNRHKTIKMFEDLGIECVKVDIRYAYTLGGGIHCWTSDVRRDGKPESYIDY